MIMNYSLTKQLIIFAVALGTLSAFPIYHAFIVKPKNNLALFTAHTTQEEIKETVEAISTQGSTVAQTLAEQLQEEHARLMANIETEFPSEQWAGMKAVLEKIKTNDTLIIENPVATHDPKDHPFINTIKQTLVSYTIDPSRVSINLVDTPGSFMAAGQGFENGKVTHSIRVNLAEVERKSEDVQLAFLKHEIMHLLNYDGLEGMFIKDVIQKSGKSLDQITSSASYIAFKKFKEYRADLLAADNPRIAESLIKDFEKIIELHPHEQTHPTHASHPTETQRKQALAQLVNYFEAENALKTA